MRKAVVVLLLSGFLLVGSVGFCQVAPSGGPGASLFGAIGAPQFLVSWAALGTITAKATASGNLSQSRFFTFGPFSSVTDEAKVGSGEGQLQFDARGLWLGASIPVYLADGLTLRARGEYFVPFHDKIWASGSGANFNSSVTRFFFGGVLGAIDFSSSTAPGHVELDASAKTRWFFIDMEASYSAAVLGGTSILAGVRYDRLVSNISRASTSNLQGQNIIPASASVTAELNSLTPYVGIRTTIGGPSGGLAFEVKGFPTVVFTKAGYKRQNGYFGEFIAEYFTGPLASNLSGSLFVRGDVIHATFSELKDFTSLFSPEGASQAPDPRDHINSSSGEAATSIHWNQLSIGGSIILSF